MAARDVVEVAEIAPDDRGRGLEPAQLDSAPSDGRRVAIDREQPAARLDRLQQEPRMPAGAQGGIHDDAPWPGLK